MGLSVELPRAVNHQRMRQVAGFSARVLEHRFELGRLRHGVRSHQSRCAVLADWLDNSDPDPQWYHATISGVSLSELCATSNPSAGIASLGFHTGLQAPPGAPSGQQPRGYPAGIHERSFGTSHQMQGMSSSYVCLSSTTHLERGCERVEHSLACQAAGCAGGTDDELVRCDISHGGEERLHGCHPRRAAAPLLPRGCTRRTPARARTGNTHRQQHLRLARASEPAPLRVRGPPPPLLGVFFAVYTSAATCRRHDAHRTHAMHLRVVAWLVRAAWEEGSTRHRPTTRFSRRATALCGKGRWWHAPHLE